MNIKSVEKYANMIVSLQKGNQNKARGNRETAKMWKDKQPSGSPSNKYHVYIVKNGETNPCPHVISKWEF